MHRFDRPTVLVTKTDLTYTVTLQTFFTLPSDNRQEAVVSQPLIAAAVSGDGARRASGNRDGEPAVGPDEGAAGSD